MSEEVSCKEKIRTLGEYPVFVSVSNRPEHFRTAFSYLANSKKSSITTHRYACSRLDPLSAGPCLRRRRIAPVQACMWCSGRIWDRRVSQSCYRSVSPIVWCVRRCGGSKGSRIYRIEWKRRRPSSEEPLGVFGFVVARKVYQNRACSGNIRKAS